MARVNITVPDDLIDRARGANLNVSRLAASALADELDRRAKIVALDDYLAEMEQAHGPVPQAELDAAERWVDGVGAALDVSRGASDAARSA